MSGENHDIDLVVPSSPFEDHCASTTTKPNRSRLNSKDKGKAPSQIPRNKSSRLDFRDREASVGTTDTESKLATTIAEIESPSRTTSSNIHLLSSSRSRINSYDSFAAAPNKQLCDTKDSCQSGEHGCNQQRFSIEIYPRNNNFANPDTGTNTGDTIHKELDEQALCSTTHISQIESSFVAVDTGSVSASKSSTSSTSDRSSSTIFSFNQDSEGPAASDKQLLTPLLSGKQSTTEEEEGKTSTELGIIETLNVLTRTLGGGGEEIELTSGEGVESGATAGHLGLDLPVSEVDLKLELEIDGERRMEDNRKKSNSTSESEAEPTSSNSRSCGSTIKSKVMDVFNRIHHALSHNPVILTFLRIPTAAESLPAITFTVITSPKLALGGLLISCIILDAIILPCWLASLIVTEIGVYIFNLAALWMLGRCIVRLIAFPGSSHRVYSEVETEFAKYSVRMLENAAESMIDFSSLLLTYSGNRTSIKDDGCISPNISSSYGMYDVLPLHKRACSYRDRVLGMYCDVLKCLLEENGSGLTFLAASKESEHVARSEEIVLTKYGNNPLVGDIGKLSSVTPQAREDGEAFYRLLKIVLADFEDLELKSSNVCNSSVKTMKNRTISLEGQAAARKLLSSAKELRDMIPSLKRPSSSSDSSSHLNNEGGVDNDVHSVRTEDDGSSGGDMLRQNHDQSDSFLNSLKSAISSILPMLDPPAHSSIFGLDVLRGAMLSRYKGARQLWVMRPKESGGGMIDVIHIPSNVSMGKPTNCRIEKAVMYCNPNAGLTEVATGMSLIGGNVSAEGSLSTDNCWTDFYVENGYDIFLFNYAGFGRSHGKRRLEDDFSSGIIQVIKRVLFNIFIAFKPTSASLKSDALAVASHVSKQLCVDKLVIHGESIGGMAAASAARNLSTINDTDASSLNRKVFPTLLICDRTFCNLEAVAQRLVGSWTGVVIPMLTPFWSTDVARDFSAATCSKIVAQDAADAIIHDASSLKAGLAIAQELRKGVTKKAGQMFEAPLEYRMADWEDVGVTESKYFNKLKNIHINAPVWPADKHISLTEAFHFAACTRRIGKVATAIKKNKALEENNHNPSEEEGIEITEIFSRDADDEDEEAIGKIKSDKPNSVVDENKVIDAWKVLACCDGLTGMPLGVAVKEGYDCTVSWLCCTVTFGCQRLTQEAEKRMKCTALSNTDVATELRDGQVVIDSKDFDFRSGSYDNDELKMRPMPMPEVLLQLQKIFQDVESVSDVKVELQYCIKILEYILARTTSKQAVADSLKAIHFHNISDEISIGCFLNLSCGHNSQYSLEERLELRKFMDGALNVTHSVC